MFNELFKKIQKLRTKLVSKRPRDFLVILNYHQVNPVFDPRAHFPGCWTQLKDFENSLIWLKNNFNMIRLDEGIRQLEESSLVGPCVAITFDDGDISLEKYVVPVLQRMKIPATFFINTAYIDSKRMSWGYMYSYLYHAPDNRLIDRIPLKLREYGIRLLRYTQDVGLYNKLREEIENNFDIVNDSFSSSVSMEFLRGLDEQLFIIGLHGHEHQRFSMMSEKWQRGNLLKNMDILSQCSTFKPIFAIPYGKPFDWNRITIRLCLELNLQILAAFGGINVNRDVYYKRIPADSMNLKTLIRKEVKRYCNG